MKLDNYKTIKKSEWQEIATKFDILWTEDSVVRYLVEKVAEKIGVDDKIVSDNELKKQVVEKINLDFEIIPVKNIKTTKPKKITNKKVVKSKTPVVKEKTPIVKEEEIIVPVLSRLEELRLECESYGIAWAENHKENNLEEVLNSVKSAGVLPISQTQNAIIPIQPAINKNEPFEINSLNANEFSESVIETQNTNPAFNPLATPPPPLENGGYGNSNAYLDTYKNIYLNAIKGHWRLLSINEIQEMILRDTQTFTFKINFHSKQQNKIEIILSQDKSSVRIPSSNNDEWLDING
jgi:hypothetical protein